VNILVGTPPGLGHLLPVVPLAWAARAAGHDVRVMTHGPAARAAAQAGLAVFDIVPDRPDALGVAMDDRIVDRAMRAVVSWPPNLVVHMFGDFIAPALATMHSIPLVLHGLGLPHPGTSAAPPPPDVASALERLGHHVVMPHAVAVLDPCPPSLREPGQPAAWPLRYVPYNGGCTLPDWLQRSSSRPRVCVTLGTQIPIRAGLRHFTPIVQALRGLGAVEFVVVLGRAGGRRIGSLPGAVQVTEWLPLTELLPTCAAIVHHGGAGTTMGAVAAGVPQLVVSYRDGATIARRGLGLTVTPDDADPGVVRGRVVRLLEDPLFRQAALEVSAENASQPPPSAAVDDLCRLVGGG
jgi:UDP:flavonoid glycosyltransferase YjiC (YdhE family)